MKRKELFAKAEAKRAQAAALMEGENPDVAAANALLDEVDAIMAEIAVLDRMSEQEIEDKGAGMAPAEERANDATKAFFDAMRSRFTNVSNLVEHTPSSNRNVDGGFTIPEDVQTAINEYKETACALETLFMTETVGTTKGSRVYKAKRTHNVMSKLDEWGTVEQVNAPHFEQLHYVIEDYAGFIPCPNNLLNDSDAALRNMLVRTLGDYDVDTKNAKILEILNAAAFQPVVDINGLRKAVNIDLGPAYKPTAAILTNEYGVNWLDNLVDGSNRPLLNPDPTDSAQLQLRCGSTIIRVIEFPSDVVPNVERDGGTFAPFYIASFEDVLKVFDRQQLSIAASDTAAIGGYNAFGSNGTLFRGISRFDVVPVDNDALILRGVRLESL